MAKSLGPAPQGEGSVSIDAAAFDAAAQAFGPDFDAAAAQMITDAMQRGAEVIQRAVVKQAKRHKRSGRLERQIKITAPTGVGFGQEIIVKSGGSVAPIIAGGARAHMIPRAGIKSHRPMPISRGRVWRVIGFAEHVQHPRVAGDPYFSRGVRNARLAVNNVFKAALNKLAAHQADVIAGRPA